MGIFTNWFKKKEPEQETRGLFCDSLMYNMNGSYTTNKAMLLSTVYRCVDVISDAVAQAFQAAGPKDVILAFGSLSFIGVLTEAVKQYKTTERGN